jgi:hypothetical protein
MAFDACRITPAVEMRQESNAPPDGGGRGEEVEKTGRDGFKNQLFGFVWKFSCHNKPTRDKHAVDSQPIQWNLPYHTGHPA